MKLEAVLWIVGLMSALIAILSPKYRGYSLLVVAVVIVAIVATVLVAHRREDVIASLPRAGAPLSTQPTQHTDFEKFHIDNLDKQDPDAKNRIGVAEIRFGQIRTEPGAEPGTIRSIRARLYNDSIRDTLTDYAYYLVVQDCVQSACTTVYDQRGQAAALVPANQARDVVITIRDGDTRGVPTFKILGTPNIRLAPTDTRAYHNTPATAN